MKLYFEEQHLDEIPVVKTISNAAKKPSITVIDDPDEIVFSFSANQTKFPQISPPKVSPSISFEEPSNYVTSFNSPVVDTTGLSNAVIRMQEEKIEELEYRLEEALRKNADLTARLGKELIDKDITKTNKFDLNKLKWD